MTKRILLPTIMTFFVFSDLSIWAKDIPCKRINLLKVHGFEKPRDVLLRNDEWKKKLTSLYEGKLIIFDGNRLAGGNKKDIAATCKLMINRVVCPTKPVPRKSGQHHHLKSVIILKGKFQKYSFDSFYSELMNSNTTEKETYFRKLLKNYPNLLHYNYSTSALKIRNVFPLQDLDFDGLSSSVIFSKVENHFYLISEEFFLKGVNYSALNRDKVCYLDLPWKSWPLYNFDHI